MIYSFCNHKLITHFEGLQKYRVKMSYAQSKSLPLSNMPREMKKQQDEILQVLINIQAKRLKRSSNKLQ